MNKKIMIPGFLLLGVLIGSIVWFAVWNAPDTVTTRVVLTGREGLPITGEYTADDREHPINEILPAKIAISAKRLSLLVESTDPAETITAELFVNDEYQMTGCQRQIEIKVRGKTMMLPRLVKLKTFNELSEN